MALVKWLELKKLAGPSKHFADQLDKCRSKLSFSQSLRLKLWALSKLCKPLVLWSLINLPSLEVFKKN